MKDNTIDTLRWQLPHQNNAQILISSRALAKYVLWQLQQLPLTVAIGSQALDVHHPEAWRGIDITSAQHLRVPLALPQEHEIAPQIAQITRILQEALTTWLGSPVTVEVHFVTTFVLSSVASEKDSFRGTH